VSHDDGAKVARPALADGVPRALGGRIRLCRDRVAVSERHPRAEDERERQGPPERSHDPDRRDGVVPERAASSWAATETPKKMVTDDRNDHI
jgi:hypothetical protein